jgi:hypothetical protein
MMNHQMVQWFIERALQAQLESRNGSVASARKLPRHRLSQLQVTPGLIGADHTLSTIHSSANRDF